MKIRFYYSITLILLSFLLFLAPVWAQDSYKITIYNYNLRRNKVFNVTGDTNQLVKNIYQRIKPSGNARPTITIPLSKTNLQKFQNLIKSQGVSTQYYEFESTNLTFKGFGKQINTSSIDSNSKNYGVILSKSGYEASKVIPFKVTQVTNNKPVLFFTDSKIVLKDATRISFILDTSSSRLDRNQIGNALLSRDPRLSQDYHNFREYQDCLRALGDTFTNPGVNAISRCYHVNFVVNISL